MLILSNLYPLVIKPHPDPQILQCRPRIAYLVLKKKEEKKDFIKCEFFCVISYFLYRLNILISAFLLHVGKYHIFSN